MRPSEWLKACSWKIYAPTTSKVQAFLRVVAALHGPGLLQTSLWVLENVFCWLPSLNKFIFYLSCLLSQPWRFIDRWTNNWSILIDVVCGQLLQLYFIMQMMEKNSARDLIRSNYSSPKKYKRSYQVKTPTIRLGLIRRRKWLRLNFNVRLLLFSQVLSENK